MIRLLFSVYDVKAQIFMAPHAYLTKAEAIRDFAGVVNKPDNDFSRNPEDFSLFLLGTIDVLSGKLEGCVASQVITGLECVKKD